MVAIKDKLRENTPMGWSCEEEECGCMCENVWVINLLKCRRGRGRLKKSSTKEKLERGD